VARWRFFEGGNAPASFGDGDGVLQHGGVEGDEGGQLNEEEEGCRVGSPREGGVAGAAAIWPNSGEGRGPGARAPSGRGRCVKGVGWVCSSRRSWERKGKGA
jgi:hypothetical protein